MASRHLVPASYHVKAAAPLPPWLMSGFLSRILQQIGRAASRGGQWAGRQTWRATKGTGRAAGRMLKTPELSGSLAIGGGAAAAQKLLFNRSKASSPATSPPAPAAAAAAAPPVSQTTVPLPPGGLPTGAPATAKARAWGETTRQYARPLAPYAPWLLGGALTGAGLYGLYHLLNRKSPDEQGDEKSAMVKLAGYPRLTGFLIACGELELDDVEITAGLTKVAAVDTALRAELQKLGADFTDILPSSISGVPTQYNGMPPPAAQSASQRIHTTPWVLKYITPPGLGPAGAAAKTPLAARPPVAPPVSRPPMAPPVAPRSPATATAVKSPPVPRTTRAPSTPPAPAALPTAAAQNAASPAAASSMKVQPGAPVIEAGIPGVKGLGRLAWPAIKKLYDYGSRGLTGLLITEDIFQPGMNKLTGPETYDGKVVGEGTVIPTSFSGAYDRYWGQPAARKQIDTQNAQIAALEELIPTLSPEDQQAVQTEWLRRKGEIDAKFAPGTPRYKAEIDAERASLSNWVHSLQAAASQSPPAAPAVDTPIESPASGAQTNPAAVSNEVAGGGPAPAAAPGIDPAAALKNPDGSPKPHQQVVVEGQKAKQEAAAAGKANPEVAAGVLKETETGEIGPFSMQGLINWAGQLDAKVEELLPAWGNLDTGAKVALGLGLSLGTISLLSAIAGEGGLWGLLGSLLGFGAAGGIAAYGGAFGETPRAFLQGLLQPPAPGGEPAQAAALGLRNTVPALPKATAEPATTPEMATAMQDVAAKVPDVVNQFAGAGGDPAVFDSPEDVKALIRSWATPGWLGGGVSDADMQRVVQALDPALRQQLVQQLQTASFPGRDKLIQMLQAG